jgi:hypothetical protein
MIALYIIALPALLWPLYVLGIQYFRGGLWRLLAPLTVAASLLDVALNYTLLAALLMRWPVKGDYTFSKTLGTLYADTGWRGDIAFYVGRKWLDPFDPRGIHVYAKPK